MESSTPERCCPLTAEVSVVPAYLHQSPWAVCQVQKSEPTLLERGVSSKQ